MKTKEELNALKEEVEILNKKLAELSVEELAQVTGGYGGRKGYHCPNVWCDKHNYIVTPPEDGKCQKCGTPLVYGSLPNIR